MHHECLKELKDASEDDDVHCAKCSVKVDDSDLNQVKKDLANYRAVQNETNNYQLMRFKCKGGNCPIVMNVDAKDDKVKCEYCDKEWCLKCPWQSHVGQPCKS